MVKAKFTISKSKVLEQYEIVESLCDIVSYSSKTNPVVTPILEKNTDTMFSVHTENELKHIVDKSRVFFIAQAWTSDKIENLVEQGITWFVVDNEVDLNTFIDYLKSKNLKGKLNLLLRLKLKEHSIRTEKYYVFGMNSNVIEQWILDIKSDIKISSKINHLGIHFHRKSQNMSEWKLQYELENTFNPDFFEQIDIINIGGGLPSVYANTNVDVFKGIYNKISELKVWLNTQNIKMMMEPGRFISAPAGKLITEVIGIHENTIVVNASVYNGDLDALIVPVKLLVEGELKKGEGKNYVIKGITPCSMDLFRYRVYLNEVKVGDTLVFINAGAYTFGSDFCDLDPMITEVVD